MSYQQEPREMKSPDCAALASLNQSHWISACLLIIYYSSRYSLIEFHVTQAGLKLTIFSFGFFSFPMQGAG